nr:MAG TPA: Thymidylate synthase complementing protein [Bacteriophage sp.]
MKMIIPGVEWWPQKTAAQQIARVGRICYKSKGKQPDENLSEDKKEDFLEEQAVKLANRFWESGHRSMYRHGTLYFFVKNDSKLPKYLWSFLVASPYINYVAQEKKVWISSNMQFLCEHGNILEMLSPFNVKEAEFIEKALKYECKAALNLLRMTLVITTQISTSRELNRTSPNSISEQSTRYVNMEKKGGVQIARPHWLHEGTKWQKFLYLSGCKVSDWLYRRLLKSGMKPQDARGILPLDTYTVVAYTYTISEWQHILDLRFRETTGKAHPNAKEVSFEINRIISERMEMFEAQKK